MYDSPMKVYSPSAWSRRRIMGTSPPMRKVIASPSCDQSGTSPRRPFRVTAALFPHRFPFTNSKNLIPDRLLRPFASISLGSLRTSSADWVFHLLFSSERDQRLRSEQHNLWQRPGPTVCPSVYIHLRMRICSGVSPRTIDICVN